MLMMGGGVFLLSDITYLNKSIHITLRTGELCGILHIDENNEVEIVPHVMLTVYMFLKACTLVIKT